MLIDFKTLQKFQFNIPTDNIENKIFYEELIRSASSIIENYIGYKFTPTSYTEYHDDLKNSRYIVAQRVPLTEVEEIYVNGNVYVGDYTFNKNNGIIRFENAFPNGTDVMIEYKAGFDEVPEDIQYATVELVQYLKKRTSGGLVGETSKTIDGGTMALETSIPLNVLHILNRYKWKDICV